MRRILARLMVVAAFTAFGFKTGGKGVNRATVQSAFHGTFYVRSVPAEEYGERGSTKVFGVRNDTDKLLDEYALYMRGRLFLGWSPIKGKWCLVHLKPERILNNDDFRKLGQIAALTFYMGGKKLCSYDRNELASLGLKRHVSFSHGTPGHFIIKGIEQVPRSNTYVLSIEKVVSATQKEILRFDITTGRPLAEDKNK